MDHLPAHPTIPTPLKFFGRIVGTPGELTYAADIHRYFQALDAASDRVKVWKIGTSEEGRDMYVLAVSDEATIANLERNRDQLKELTDRGAPAMPVPRSSFARPSRPTGSPPGCTPVRPAAPRW